MFLFHDLELFIFSLVLFHPVLPNYLVYSVVEYAFYQNKYRLSWQVVLHGSNQENILDSINLPVDFAILDFSPVCDMCCSLIPYVLGE